MNRYYTDDPHRKISGGPKWRQNSAGESPPIVYRSADWPGLPGPGQPRDRSVGVQEIYNYPAHAGLSKGGKKWIQKAIKHPGALTQQAHKAGESPMEFAASHKHSPGTTGKQARLALTLSKMHK